MTRREFLCVTVWPARVFGRDSVTHGVVARCANMRKQAKA